MNDHEQTPLERLLTEELERATGALLAEQEHVSMLEAEVVTKVEANQRYESILKSEIMRLRAEASDMASKGQRLALELECLLLDINDNAIVSKWWDSAWDAIEDWRKV